MNFSRFFVDRPIFASVLSIIIFVVVGLVSWIGFRQTRKLEEIM